jgi:hypothetical protein
MPCATGKRWKWFEKSSTRDAYTMMKEGDELSKGLSTRCLTKMFADEVVFEWWRRAGQPEDT